MLNVSASMLGCACNSVECSQSTMRREERERATESEGKTGNRMLDPTKTHNSMIYLFMDIKMHVSLRSFSWKLWQTSQKKVYRECFSLANESTLDCMCVCVPSFALFNIPLLQWSLTFQHAKRWRKNHLEIQRCANINRRLLTTHRNTIVIVIAQSSRRIFIFLLFCVLFVYQCSIAFLECKAFSHYCCREVFMERMRFSKCRKSGDFLMESESRKI